MRRPHAAEDPTLDYQAAPDLREALRGLMHATEQATRRHGLTPRRYELLLFVKAAEAAGRPATVTSLSSRLQTAQGSVTQLVNGAVRAGLLTRTPMPRDRRSHQLHLTTDGQHRLERTFLELGAQRDRLAEIVERNRR